MAQHLGLRLVVVAPVPNRGCSRCRPKEGVIGYSHGDLNFYIKSSLYVPGRG